eukprot:2871642-Rhodomonas_salina.1
MRTVLPATSTLTLPLGVKYPITSCTRPMVLLMTVSAILMSFEILSESTPRNACAHAIDLSKPKLPGGLWVLDVASTAVNDFIEHSVHHRFQRVGRVLDLGLGVAVRNMALDCIPEDCHEACSRVGCAHRDLLEASPRLHPCDFDSLAAVAGDGGHLVVLKDHVLDHQVLCSVAVDAVVRGSTQRAVDDGALPASVDGGPESSFGGSRALVRDKRLARKLDEGKEALLEGMLGMLHESLAVQIDVDVLTLDGDASKEAELVRLAWTVVATVSLLLLRAAAYWIPVVSGIRVELDILLEGVDASLSQTNSAMGEVALPEVELREVRVAVEVGRTRSQNMRALGGGNAVGLLVLQHPTDKNHMNSGVYHANDDHDEDNGSVSEDGSEDGSGWSRTFVRRLVLGIATNLNCVWLCRFQCITQSSVERFYGLIACSSALVGCRGSIRGPHRLRHPGMPCVGHRDRRGCLMTGV